MADKIQWASNTTVSYTHLHAVLRSPGAGRSGPQGIGFPHSSAHVRMNVGGVRMKLIIKGRACRASFTENPFGKPGARW